MWKLYFLIVWVEKIRLVLLFIAYFILSIGIPDYIFAFEDSSDSLHHELKKASDTSRINILLELAEQNMFRYPDSTIYYGTKALEKSEKMGFVSGKAKSYMKIADGHYFKNEFNLSIDYLSKVAAVFEESNDLMQYAECFNRIGVNYNRMGNYAQAKAHSLKALKNISGRK